jgi:threonine dehydrogenase-like Zn-dependent dehydrogenase
MKAARYHGNKDIRVEEVPRPPKPGPGQVLINVEWNGICGSDLHEYTHGSRSIRTKSDSQQLTIDKVLGSSQPKETRTQTHMERSL